MSNYHQKFTGDIKEALTNAKIEDLDEIAFSIIYSACKNHYWGFYRVRATIIECINEIDIVNEVKIGILDRFKFTPEIGYRILAEDFTRNLAKDFARNMKTL